MNNLLKKLTPPEPLGQCDSNFIGMFKTVRFIQMMSLTFGLFTQVSDSGPLGPLVCNGASCLGPSFTMARSLGVSCPDSVFCRTCFSKVRYRRPVFRPSVCLLQFTSTLVFKF